MIKPLENWIDIIVLAIFMSLALSLGSCEEAHAEPSEIVLQTIAMESASEPIEGQIMVAKTIQNRARRGNISHESVVLKPKQYSCWNDHKWAKAWLAMNYTPNVRQRASKAWEMALGEPSKTTHYHRHDIMPYWAVRHKGVRLGNHIFYEGIK